MSCHTMQIIGNGMEYGHIFMELREMLLVGKPFQEPSLVLLLLINFLSLVLLFLVVVMIPLPLVRITVFSTSLLYTNFHILFLFCAVVGYRIVASRFQNCYSQPRPSICFIHTPI